MIWQRLHADVAKQQRDLPPQHVNRPYILTC